MSALTRDVADELAALVRELETVPEEVLASDLDLVADLVDQATAQSQP